MANSFYLSTRKDRSQEAAALLEALKAQGVGGAERRGHFLPHLSLVLRRAFLSASSLAERSSPSRVRFAAPNNGAPLTSPGRSELHLLGGEKGSFQKAADNLGAKGAKMAPFFTATDTQGWERTFDWTEQSNVGPDGYADTALAEIAAVREADVLLVLLPGGYGTHVEIGAAIALGKPVILHAPDRTTLETPYPCVFHYHPQVKLLISEVVDVDQVIASMRM